MKFRLIYLWIEEYKNVQQKELNFTLDYTVIRDESSKTISVKKREFGNLNEKNKNPLKDLDNFSAVVGKNGSGKSNIFDLLSYLNVQGDFPEALSDKNFVIVECESDTERTLKLISSGDYYKDSYVISGIEASKTIFDNMEEFNNNTILYHPLNDLSAGSSTTYNRNLTKITSNPFQKLLYGDTNSQLARQFADNIKALEDIDLFREVSSNEFANLIIQYSELCGPLIEDKVFHGSFDVMTKKSWLYRLYSKLVSGIDVLEPDIDSYRRVYVYRGVLSLLHRAGARSNSYINALVISFFILNDEEFKVDIQKRIERYSLSKYVDVFRRHMVMVDEYLSYFAVSQNVVNGSCLSILAGEADNLGLFDFFCTAEDIELVTDQYSFSGPNLSIKIDGLSSGEVSIVHFINELKKAIDNCMGGSILLLLDEPEVSFHPEWQRRLISVLIELFDKLNVTPQVLISSHSPFVLSDILSGKALMLGGDRYIESCFASNIHELLANTFFLSSTIGETAKRKINLLVEFFNTPEKNTELGETIEVRQKGALLIIDQVGDKLLRNELRKRFNKVLSDNFSHNQLLSTVMSKSITNEQFLSSLNELIEHHSEEA